MTEDTTRCDLINIWGRVVNDGAGSAFCMWHLTEQEAIQEEDAEEEGWGEETVFKVETFEGSNIHIKALNGINQ